MSAYLTELIKKLEAEAERARALLKKFEGSNAAKRSLENDSGALKRILQRLETLEALQETEQRLSKRRQRVMGRSPAVQMRQRAQSRAPAGVRDRRARPRACGAGASQS
jgi:hypothetical protein